MDLYNILFETHEKININNLICESLNPEHELAVLFKSLEKRAYKNKNSIITK
jgi:hypothetical protein